MGVRLVDGALVDDGEPTVIEEVPQDVTDEPSPPVTGGDPLCEVCGEAIPYAGRGRRPRFHPEHRPTAPRRSASEPVRGNAIRNEANLRAALLARYMQIGNLLSLIHPAYGMGVKQKAEEAVNADIEYARVSPTFRRNLEAMIEKTALGAVIAVHGAMLAPIVVGERTKAMAKGARVKQAQTATPSPPPPAPTARPMPGPSRTGNVFVGDFPTLESDVAPETVNAGSMFGMPG